jgi:hypothetical protein
MTNVDVNDLYLAGLLRQTKLTNSEEVPSFLCFVLIIVLVLVLVLVLVIAIIVIDDE